MVFFSESQVECQGALSESLYAAAVCGLERKIPIGVFLLGGYRGDDANVGTGGHQELSRKGSIEDDETVATMFVAGRSLLMHLYALEPKQRWN